MSSDLDLRQDGPVATDLARRTRPAVAGALSAVAALATGELVAGLLPGGTSLVEAVGSRVIDSVPPGVKDLAITLFGTNDKIALIVGIIVVALLAGALLGILARRMFAVGVGGFLAFGVLGFLSALGEVTGTGPSVTAAVAALVAAVAGSVALWWLLRAAAAATPSGAGTAPSAQTSSPDAGDDGPPSRPVRSTGGLRQDRRGFLRAVLVVSTTAVVSAAAGRYLLQRAGARAARADIALPPPGERLPAPPDAASLDVEGLSELFTPNEIFYRIDTALSVPQVVPDEWRLRITGMVDEEVELTYDDLLAMPQVERDITIACVSNQVGGNLIGNARWTGVPLQSLLERAGVAEGVEQVVGRSVDGFTAGFPVEAAFDGRDALVAVGMNGEPLPLVHGFPARLVVPGLYGYVSATKWLSEIELTTWDFKAYWVPRGWAARGPIKTQSRIDVPGGGDDVTAGRQPIAGVAWAPTRGIQRVEVQVDDGEWREARLSEPLNDDTWRQWVVEWDASAGSHTIRVRATDGAGETQPEERTPPAPDGATGWHTIEVQVA